MNKEPETIPDDIELSLESISNSEDLIKWLSDVDSSKFISDWLVEEYDFPKWKVRLGLKLLTPLVVSGGKHAVKLMSDTMKQRLLKRISRYEWIRGVIDKLNIFSAKVSEKTKAENELKEILGGKIDRSAGDIEHRNALSLDLQADLKQFGMLDKVKDDLGSIIELLNQQPEFKCTYSEGNERHKFIYRSQYIPFVGREEELQLLDGFLYSDKRFSWQSVLGPGGVGKSRLGLEFCLRNGGAYRAGILEDINFEFEKWKPSQPTLIVIDYASKDQDRLIRVFEILSNRAPRFDYNVRVLILDRENSDHKLQKLIEHADISRMIHSAPLFINESESEIAEGIFDFFYGIERKEIPETWDDHLEKLKEIDPLMRPLFAAYFADAVAKGGCGKEYSRKSLLLDVIKREDEKFWKPNGVTEEDKALLALATIVGGISSMKKKTLPDCVTALSEIIRNKDRFRALNGEAKKYPELEHVIPAWEPDLVGELFVLDFLSDDFDTYVENDFRSKIIEEAWILQPRNTALFLSRASEDYLNHPTFNKLIHIPEKVGISFAFFWSLLALSLVAAYGDSDDLVKAEDVYAELKLLVQVVSEKSLIALSLAKATFSLIIYYARAKNVSKVDSFLLELVVLVEKFPDNLEIASLLDRFKIHKI
ncbi:ATP-binding protein [Maridesulfovibrio ferrireducens]|uniref:ATP-binding protein n=1 Tax=Maridesulfovibrio ferrireducens TaxID=246191 RepID=UPI001A1F4A96|nr:ATP-binding protein [Maridesulfovibrio ferrireducens]MBI9112483.1 ATP-binding protein [Maridesulfovibrio ferrireducens]